MKPMVVSAATAERAPKAVPSVSAALPCNRCRREILPQSMGVLLLADETAADFAASPFRRSPQRMSQSSCQWSPRGQHSANPLKHLNFSSGPRSVQNLCMEINDKSLGDIP